MSSHAGNANEAKGLLQYGHEGINATTLGMESHAPLREDFLPLKTVIDRLINFRSERWLRL